MLKFSGLLLEYKSPFYQFKCIKLLNIKKIIKFLGLIMKSIFVKFLN